MKTDFVNGYESPFIQRSMWRSVRIVLFMLFVSFHAYAQAEEDGQKYLFEIYNLVFFVLLYCKVRISLQ